MLKKNTLALKAADAAGLPEEYICQAESKGLNGICFTTHIDLNPKRAIVDRWVRVDGLLRGYSAEFFERYVDTIRELAEKSDISVLLGFEFSYQPFFTDLIQDFIDKYSPDFTIGSLHCLDDVGFTAGNESYYPLRFFPPQKFLESYAESMIEMSRSSIFNAIGHIDGYKKYACRHWNIDDKEAVEKKIFPQIFREFAQNDTAFEINTASIRKGLKDFYPRRELLEMAMEHGVCISSIGSDAHRPQDVGFMFPEVKSLMADIGISLKPLKLRVY